MKTIKHILKYIFEPRYRTFVDLMTSKELVDRQINQMKEQLELSKFPPFFQDKLLEYRAVYGNATLGELAEIIKVRENITS